MYIICRVKFDLAKRPLLHSSFNPLPPSFPHLSFTSPCSYHFLSAHVFTLPCKCFVHLMASYLRCTHRVVPGTPTHFHIHTIHPHPFHQDFCTFVAHKLWHLFQKTLLYFLTTTRCVFQKGKVTEVKIFFQLDLKLSSLLQASSDLSVTVSKQDIIYMFMYIVDRAFSQHAFIT